MYSWVHGLGINAEFVFTVGEYKAPAFAQPHNSPDYIGSILSNSAHITTFSGVPFIQYNVGGDYYIRFEIPDFKNPPEEFYVYLHFQKGSGFENEPVKITIINTPPVLDGTLASEITIYDGKTGTLNFHASDPENSNLLEIRFEGTLPPPWITLTPDGLF